MAATRRGTGEIGRSLLDLSMAATGEEPEDRDITLDLSMAATGGERERQGDHFGSESLVDSSRRADAGGIEGRRCSR